jgi:mycothiol system anti-sigma-R factor
MTTPSHQPYDPFGDLDGNLLGDCNAMVARLYNFLDGELTDQRREKIQRHLDMCPSCFGAFDFEAELRIVVSTRCHTEVPQSLVDRIRNSICPPND